MTYMLDSNSYHVAIELERAGSWRTWLGEKDFNRLKPHLLSENTWQHFLTTGLGASLSDRTESDLDLFLQLRCRSLLCDISVDGIYNSNESYQSGGKGRFYRALLCSHS